MTIIEGNTNTDILHNFKPLCKKEVYELYIVRQLQF